MLQIKAFTFLLRHLRFCRNVRFWHPSFRVSIRSRRRILLPRIRKTPLRILLINPLSITFHCAQVIEGREPDALSGGTTKHLSKETPSRAQFGAYNLGLRWQKIRGFPETPTALNVFVQFIGNKKGRHQASFGFLRRKESNQGRHLKSTILRFTRPVGLWHHSGH